MRRFIYAIGGVLLGLVLVESALQAVKLAVASSDASRTRHASADHGGDLRVLCLGACYTIGIGTPPEAAYPAQLERRLDALLSPSGGDAVVINGGQRGKSIDHFASEIKPLLKAHAPDVLIVGVNRRTSLSPSPPLDLGVLDHLILPRLVGLALSPPDTSSPLRLDPIAQQIRDLEAFVQANPDRRKARSELSTLHAKRGDFQAALDVLAPLHQGRPSVPPPLSLRLFRYTIALGDFDTATGHLDAVRAAPGFVDDMERDMTERKGTYDEEGRNTALRGALDRARLAVVRNTLPKARTLLDEVLAIDPDTADAWHLLAYLDHIEGRPVQARSEAFLGDSHTQQQTELSAFRVALDAHLERILAAARVHGTRVALHTLAAAPEQLPVIHEVAAARGVPVVDVQAALANVADPDPLFHPTDHLRFSEAGNAWLAAQIHTGLADAALVPAPDSQ